MPDGLVKIYIGYWQTCQYSCIYLYSYICYMSFNQQQCFIYSTASFLSKLRAKKVEKLRILVIKQLFVVLVNTVISWIRLADLNPCTTCTMYISLTIFLFRSGIAFYFHLFSTVQVTIRPKQLLTCDHWLVEVQKSKHRNVCINIIRICINFVLHDMFYCAVFNLCNLWCMSVWKAYFVLL